MSGILLVDDDPDLRRTVAILLDGYQILQAGDGRQALEVARRYRPDLVLLDVVMPVMGGPETLIALRAAYPAIPIVMLTSETEIELARSTLSMGATEYITKPFDVEYLRAEVARLLGIEDYRPDKSGRPWRIGT